MQIRTKLVLNTVSLVIINVIVISSGVVGVLRVRDKLGDLTQRTPYQNGTLNLQRAVQSVVASLTRASAGRSFSNLETAKADASKALEEVKAAEKALSSMSPARFVGPEPGSGGARRRVFFHDGRKPQG